MARFLGFKMDSIVDVILAALVKASGSSKKLITGMVMMAIKTVLACTSWHPKSVSIFLSALQEKSATMRLAASEILRLSLERLASDGELSRQAERHNLVEGLEKGIKKALGDADGTIRAFGREAFYFFNLIWPQKGNLILSQLDTASVKAISKLKTPAKTLRMGGGGLIGGSKATALKPAAIIPTSIIVSTPTAPIVKHEEVPTRTIVKQTTPPPPISRVVKEEEILVLLEEKRIDGIRKLVILLQEKEFSLFHADHASKIQMALMGIYTDYSNIQNLEEALDFDTIKGFIDYKMINAKEMLVPLLKIRHFNGNESLISKVEDYMRHIQCMYTLSELIGILLNAIPFIVSIRIKKNSGEKDAELKSREYVVDWIMTLLSPTSPNDEMEVDAFWQDSNIRLIMNRIIPITKHANLQDKCRFILSQAYSSAEKLFRRTLETFDIEDVELVINLCEIMAEEESEVITLEYDETVFTGDENSVRVSSIADDAVVDVWTRFLIIGILTA